ncbi:MAG: hypothetical protein ABIM99_05615 [Candidatus Dojkabacteria bacterium]
MNQPEFPERHKASLVISDVTLLVTTQAGRDYLIGRMDGKKITLSEAEYLRDLLLRMKSFQDPYFMEVLKEYIEDLYQINYKN